MTDVKTIKCSCWEEFILIARNKEAGRKVGGRIYRGHASPSWKLASLFERWLDQRRGFDAKRSVRSFFGPTDPEIFLDLYLRRFREAATGAPGMRTDNLKDDEWWIWGRHHGLITRLLDWTWSPYIAAFFAFTEYLKEHWPGFQGGLPNEPHYDRGPVVVWALAPFHDLFVGDEFELISSRKDMFYRQRAQQGVFTRLRHDPDLDVQSYLTRLDKAYYLERIEIPGLEAGKALNDLRLMNVSFSTLFPDPEGAALDANLAPLMGELAGSGIVAHVST